MSVKFWTAISILWGIWCLYGAIARGVGCWGLETTPKAEAVSFSAYPHGRG